MATVIREIHIERTVRLDDYAPFEHERGLFGELLRLGESVAAHLGPRRVWMLNSTASGGGVAEMLPREVQLLEDAGVDVRWLVLETDRHEFFRVTKALHHLLHGSPATLPPDAAGVYDAVCREAVDHLGFLSAGDVLVVHDPQPAGIARYIEPHRRPRLVWRSHVGVASTNAHTERAWDFLRPILEPYERLLFSAEPYIPAEHLARSGTLAPGIDPLSHKNRELTPYKLVGILRAAGLHPGPPPPEWARFCAPALTWTEGRWQARPLPNVLTAPFVLQVSRFDPLKGFDRVIPAFAEVLRLAPEAIVHARADLRRLESECGLLELVLAGPDPSGIADDPEADDVLEALCAQHAALPPELARRVHLLKLPMEHVKQNALMVNALQRAASVVVQNSLREGFGLTVTEALWKRTPVVAANVGGISMQMRDATDGVLIQDPTDPRSVAESLVHTLVRPREAEAMARSGHARVREHYLVLTQVRGWLRELDALLGRPAPAAG